MNDNFIKKDTFERLCALQCELKEIAGAFGVTEEQVRVWCKNVYKNDFEEVYRRLSNKGKISIRNLQFKLAEKSPTMAIYLGKVYLNQDDKGNQENKD